MPSMPVPAARCGAGWAPVHPPTGVCASAPQRALSLALGVEAASGWLPRSGRRDFGFERFCKLIAVRPPNPRVPQPGEESPRQFAARGLGAVDANGRSAPGFLGFGHGTTPAGCAHTKNDCENGSHPAPARWNGAARGAQALRIRKARPTTCGRIAERHFPGDWTRGNCPPGGNLIRSQPLSRGRCDHLSTGHAKGIRPWQRCAIGGGGTASSHARARNYREAPAGASRVFAFVESRSPAWSVWEQGRGKPAATPVSLNDQECWTSRLRSLHGPTLRREPRRGRYSMCARAPPNVPAAGRRPHRRKWRAGRVPALAQA
jgi:hypothetical protein